MKKRILFCLLLIICLAFNSILICGCQPNNDEQEENYIELTMDNYEYYLTINRFYVDDSYSIKHYDYNISGAIPGLYVDCVVYYDNYPNPLSIELNAGGNAQVCGRTYFRVTNVTGRIYLYNQSSALLTEPHNQGE